MRIFILEDDHERINTLIRKLAGHEVIVSETAHDAVDKLFWNNFDVIFLDHDLGGNVMVPTSDMNTGSEVVRYMILLSEDCEARKEKWHWPTVIIHSMNEPAARNMHDKLTDLGVTCHRIPFIKLVHDLDEPNFLSVAESTLEDECSNCGTMVRLDEWHDHMETCE